MNNREDGDLRRHRAHYDVTVMFTVYLFLKLHERDICLAHLEISVAANLNDKRHWSICTFIQNSLYIYFYGSI